MEHMNLFIKKIPNVGDNCNASLVLLKRFFLWNFKSGNIYTYRFYLLMCNMFDINLYLSNIFNNHNIRSVLDLWWGNWKYSVYAASYGCNVVAVDSNNMQGYLYPIYLKQHPKITFIQEDIIRFITDHPKEKTYDLIMIINVIVFLEKKIFMKILPKILDLLHDKWTLVISFFFEDDETMSKNTKLSFYEFDDFVLPKWYQIFRKEDEMVEDIHKPYGAHKHHIWYIEIQKV